MLILIGELNGQKIKIPVTADTGTGAPVGSFIYMYKKSNPSGYLYCDGSTFDQTKYPALYQYLGSNVLPDYRECVAVGAEQNTTDTIATHDVYTEGQFKDDQMQMLKLRALGEVNSTGTFVTLPTVSASAGNTLNITTDRTSSRIGDTTHGKQKAVFIYIKATSGLTENQQENVLNTINENLSYSTAEHKTGKKWIDGKDIWSKVLQETFISSGTIDVSALNIDHLVDLKGDLTNSYNDQIFMNSTFADSNTVASVTYNTGRKEITMFSTATRTENRPVIITLEYTKTTDN